MKKFQYKNNNMKRIILIFLGLFSLAYAQYSPTGAKTQFKNGLGLGSKDSSAFLANDSLAITIDRNNRLLWRNNGSNGSWNVVAKVGATDFIINQSGSNLSAQTAKFRITDTGWINNVLRTNKALLDSIQASSSAGGYLVTNGGSAVMHWGGGGSVEVDFKGFAGYDANRASNYTSRSFTDKGYVDSATIKNQFGSNLSAQTAKWRINDSGWANILITDSHLRSDSIRSADLRISGQLTMNNAEAIVMKRTNGLGSSVLQMTAADTIAIGNQTQGTVLYGSNPLKFVSGTNRQEMPNLSGTVALMGAANVGSFEVTNQIIGTSANFTGAVTGGNIAGTNVTASNDITGNDGVFSDSVTTNTLNATGKIVTTDSIVGANARFTGTIDAVGRIRSISPIVSTDRGVGTTAFQAQMNTSALNDSLIVMLGQSANGTYNLFDITQYQRVANASTGGFSLNIYDAGGKQQIQKWETDSVIIGRKLNVRGQTTISQTGVPLIVNSINSNTNKLTFQDNGTDRGSVGATSTNALVVANSGGTSLLTVNNSTGQLTAASLTTSGSGVTLAVNATNSNLYKMRFQDNGTDRSYIGASGTDAFNVANNTAGTVLFTINNASGYITNVGTYNTTVGGTNRDVFVDNNGVIGYVSSFRASKKNITPLDSTTWLHQLNPVKFNYRKKDKSGKYTDSAYNELEYGLIAEEVEPVNKEMVFYDVDSTGKHLRGVSYSKLIVPMLKEIQDQKKTITELEARIAKLESIMGATVRKTRR